MAKLSRRSILIGAGAGIAGLAAGGAYVAIPLFGATAAQTELTPPEAMAAAAAGEILLVDIRQPWEWEKTGVPQGAIPLDLRREDFIERVLEAQATPSQPIAVICARGVRSRRLTLRLDEAGVGPIIDIPEGMLGSVAGPGWLRRELPVTEWDG